MSTALAVQLRQRAAMQAHKRIKLRKPPKPKWPHQERALYYRDLMALLQIIELQMKRYVVPQLDRIVAAHNVTRPEDEPIRLDGDWLRCVVPEHLLRLDAGTGDAVEDLVGELEAEVDEVATPAKIEMLAQTNVVRVALWQGKELQRVVQHVAAINLIDDTTGIAEHLDVAVQENVRLITDLKSGTLDAIKGVILRGARTGVHSSAIAEQLQLQLGISQRRAALIATDQVGKLNGELNQIRQQRLGVRRYRWSSSQDERVRPRHRELNATIQEWGKPPVVDLRTGERAHPGQPVRCRCQAIPIIDDVLVDAGLMDPSEVELFGPPKPLGKVKLPQRTPANLPPTLPPEPPKGRRRR